MVGAMRQPAPEDDQTMSTPEVYLFLIEVRGDVGP